MSKINNFLSSLRKLCKKDLFIALMFFLVVLETIGTTAVLFGAHFPFFAVVNIVASVVLAVFYVAICTSGDEE